MSGLNVEVYNYDIISEQSDDVRRYRTYEVEIGPKTGTVYLNTVKDFFGILFSRSEGATESFGGLFPNERTAKDRDLEGVQMGGYVGTHERDGVLSIGTPWRAASDVLMNLAVEAAESGNARLVVDEDHHNQLDGEDRQHLYGVLRDMLPEAGVPVVEEKGRLVPYYPTGRQGNANKNAEKAERLLHEKIVDTPIPEGRPAPGAPTWKNCFIQHLLEAFRSSRARYRVAADAAITRWEHDEAVQAALSATTAAGDEHTGVADLNNYL